MCAAALAAAVAPAELQLLWNLAQMLPWKLLPNGPRALLHRLSPVADPAKQLVLCNVTTGIAQNSDIQVN